MPEYYRVAVPTPDEFPFLERYPWLAKGFERGKRPPAIEITFSNGGLPLRITPSDARVSKPTLTWVKNSPVEHAFNSVSRVTGLGDQGSLTGSGERYLSLLLDQFP